MSATNKKKMFLLSLLPEIEPMANAQMSSFRRRVLQFIDDIINPAPYQQLNLQHTPNSLMSSYSSENQHNDTVIYYEAIYETLDTNNPE